MRGGAEAVRIKTESPLREKKRFRAGCAASMTVEAALALPLFLFFCVNILYVTEMVRLQSNINGALREVGNQLSYYTYYYEYATEGIAAAVSSLGDHDSIGGVLSLALTQTYVRGPVEELLGRDYLNNTCLVGGCGGISYLRSGMLGEDGVIDLVADYKVKPLIPLIAYPEIRLQSRYYGHAWIGYHAGDGASYAEEEDEETVFVTKTGTVYHRERFCTYLQPAIRGTDAASVDLERNNGGACYYACEVCRPKKTGTLYITKDGTRFHSSRTCSALKRTVREVKLSSVVGRMPPCSKCGY